RSGGASRALGPRVARRGRVLRPAADDELGIPDEMIGASDPEYGTKRAAFMPHDREGGNIITGITVNSGGLNPDLLKGQKGGRLWPRARLRDRVDAIIAHEWAESNDRQSRQGVEPGRDDRAAGHGRGEADSLGHVALARPHPSSVNLNVLSRPP